MYERFTDRARKVLALATHEAYRYQHDHIGTEHLLLGLLREGSGIAACVLMNLGVTLPRLYEEIAKSCFPSSFPPAEGQKLPQTVAARQVIEHAIEEASTLGHNCIGTEHLLLGLYREAIANRGLACGLLQDLGVDIQQIRVETLALIAPESPPPSSANERLVAGRNYVEQFLAPLMSDLQGQLMKKFPGLCVSDYTFHLSEEVGTWTIPVLAGPVDREEDSHA